VFRIKLKRLKEKSIGSRGMPSLHSNTFPYNLACERIEVEMLITRRLLEQGGGLEVGRIGRQGSALIPVLALDITTNRTRFVEDKAILVLEIARLSSHEKVRLIEPTIYGTSPNGWLATYPGVFCSPVMRLMATVSNGTFFSFKTTATRLVQVDIG
jgi:hypothetical protein